MDGKEKRKAKSNTVVPEDAIPTAPLIIVPPAVVSGDNRDSTMRFATTRPALPMPPAGSPRQSSFERESLIETDGERVRASFDWYEQ